jgi:hypothetical protein
MNMSFSVRSGIRAGLVLRRCPSYLSVPDCCQEQISRLSNPSSSPLVTPGTSVPTIGCRQPLRVPVVRSIPQNKDVLLTDTQPVATAAVFPPAPTAPFDGSVAAEIPSFVTADHPFSRFWRAYNKALDESPILVKSATSFFGFLIGDIIAQNIVGLPFDYWRTFRLVLFGIFMDGPVGMSHVRGHLGATSILYPLGSHCKL